MRASFLYFYFIFRSFALFSRYLRVKVKFMPTGRLRPSLLDPNIQPRLYSVFLFWFPRLKITIVIANGVTADSCIGLDATVTRSSWIILFPLISRYLFSHSIPFASLYFTNTHIVHWTIVFIYMVHWDILSCRVGKIFQVHETSVHRACVEIIHACESINDKL